MAFSDRINFGVHPLIIKYAMWAYDRKSNLVKKGHPELFKPVYADPAHYEYVLLSFLSTSKLSLRVDYSDGRNCSYLSPKCMRTMLNLDAWNALDDYAEVFDVKYYRRHFEQLLAELYRGYLRKNNFALEQRAYFRKKNILLSVQMKAWRIVFAKILRKILRGESTSHKFEPK